MKYALIILTIFNLPLFGSCLIKIDNEGDNRFNITSWKHVDGKDDLVVSINYPEKELKEISGILSQHKEIKFIFNEGVFTSMKYSGGSTKKWGNLSNAEKDMVFFLQNKFNVKETDM